jgi:tetratricopeptide (TPR) repeat protein
MRASVVPDLAHAADPEGLFEQARRCEQGGALDRALDGYRSAAAQAADPALESSALCAASRVLRATCQWDDAITTARRSGEAARRAGRGDLVADALNAEATVHHQRGDAEQAQAIYEEILRSGADERRRGVALQNLGSLAAARGDLATAERRFLESYRCFRAASYTFGEVFALNNYACAALDQGNPEIAEAMLDEALERARAAEDLELVAIATKNHAQALGALGRRIEALDAASVALGHFTTVGDAVRQVECFELMGDLNADAGEDPETALVCYRRGAALAREIGADGHVTRLADRILAVQHAARATRPPRASADDAAPR